MTKSEPNEFDYIIVGAGSAGATLARRLLEIPHTSVCLLEAGKPDSNPLIHIPFGLSLMARFKSLNWNYNTVPQTHLANRELYWPRGKTLGGSSSVNAMCYIRGAKEDYDQWQSLGADGWGWEDVLPYFKKSEDQQHGPSEFHGVGGPLAVRDLRYINPVSESFLQASEQTGHKHLGDFNTLEREGMGRYQVTQKNGQRCSTAKGYLTPMLEHSHLTLRTGALVEKVLLEGERAVGVNVNVEGRHETLRCRREVILCGGAINSPQVLMLSGIGPAEHLQSVGVDVKHDLPGVGENLQDHLDAIVQHKMPVPEGYGVAFGALPQYIRATFNYMFKRSDIFSSNIAETGGFAKSNKANGLPDLQYHFLPAILQDHGRSIMYGYGFGLHVCCLYPKSRGSIKLHTANPTKQPLIDPNYLSHEDDRAIMIDGVRQAREILNSEAFSQYRSEEFAPGANATSDDDILKFLQEKAETIYHPVGTCKMGAEDDPMAVVNSELKVRGVEGLRVVDASIMPTLIGGNTNAPTVMVAEKIADVIKALH